MWLTVRCRRRGLAILAWWSSVRRAVGLRWWGLAVLAWRGRPVSRAILVRRRRRLLVAALRRRRILARLLVILPLGRGVLSLWRRVMTLWWWRLLVVAALLWRGFC